MFDNHTKILRENGFVHITGLCTTVATDRPEGFMRVRVEPKSSWAGKWTIITVLNRCYIVLVTCDSWQVWLRPKFNHEDINMIGDILYEVCPEGYEDNMVGNDFDKFFSGYPGHPIPNISGVYERLVDPNWSDNVVTVKSSDEIKQEIADGTMYRLLESNKNRTFKQ